MMYIRNENKFALKKVGQVGQVGQFVKREHTQREKIMVKKSGTSGTNGTLATKSAKKCPTFLDWPSNWPKHLGHDLARKINASNVSVPLGPNFLYTPPYREMRVCINTKKKRVHTHSRAYGYVKFLGQVGQVGHM